jgi:membrane protease YdiL (CAAX protease family)
VNEHENGVDHFSNLERTGPTRGRPIIAWMIVLATLCVVFGVQRGRRDDAADPTAMGRAGLIMIQIQARALIWQRSFADRERIIGQLEQLNSGPVVQRLCYVIVIGEMLGARDALARLEQLDAKVRDRNVTLSEEQTRLRTILGRLYDDYVAELWLAPSLAPSDRELLSCELGWFGELAMTPARSPDRQQRREVLSRATQTIVAVVAVALWFGLGLFFGVFALLVFIVLLCLNRLRASLREPSDAGGIYAETFAVWVVLYLVLSLLAQWIPTPQEARIGIVAGAMFGSLAALAWPVLRGIAWSQLRRDLGWTGGRSIISEPFCGLACYGASLPIVAGVLFVTFLFIAVYSAMGGLGGPPNEFSSVPMPVHPVIEAIATPGWYVPLQVYLLAALVAPIVEETMFRGVLYRHLRDASSRFGGVLSVLFSGLVCSLLFAAVHPQGPIAIPALTTLAFGFTMAREWRGTLIPAVTAHAVNNAVVITLLVFCAR